ncbi:hypothetical protein ZWY2020_007758 [Hordeum vulgare]|nr:hypothetical protein ZWY2020_007758 [Hordeum vulgare]
MAASTVPPQHRRLASATAASPLRTKLHILSEPPWPVVPLHLATAVDFALPHTSRSVAASVVVRARTCLARKHAALLAAPTPPSPPCSSSRRVRPTPRECSPSPPLPPPRSSIRRIRRTSPGHLLARDLQLAEPPRCSVLRLARVHLGKVSYMAERVVGTGLFGVVYQPKCLETGETVAIKKVLQDKRYKNRELQTMQLLDHPNVVDLKHHFFSTTERGEVYLNLVLEYVSPTEVENNSCI